MTSRRNFLAAPLAALAVRRALAQQAPPVDVHRQLVEQIKNAPMAWRFDGETKWEIEAWQEKFRAKLDDLLGQPRPPAVWKTTVESTDRLDGYTRQSLILEAEGHTPLPVYLLRPDGGAKSKPAVVALHGHGPLGHDAVVGIAKTNDDRKHIQETNYDYAAQLARRGYVVAAPCFQPFGRRLDSVEAYHGDDACAVTFVRMQLLGKILIAENLRDALWSFELLRSQADVADDRIGCVGLSYGGRMTMLAAALEPRIRVAVVSGALNMMQERTLGRYSCGAQIIPGLLQYGDVPEIGSLIAPRPALWEVGERDKLMVKEWIGPAWEKMQKAYGAYSAADRLSIDRFDGMHRWNGVKAYPLLDSVLKAG